MRALNGTSAAIPLLAAVVLAAGCGNVRVVGHESSEFISATEARSAADQAEGGSWDPAKVTVVFRNDYRARGGAPKQPVWVVSYIGGDVCIPAHGGDGTAPCANREDVLVNARSGKFIAANARVVEQP